MLIILFANFRNCEYIQQWCRAKTNSRIKQLLSFAFAMQNLHVKYCTKKYKIANSTTCEAAITSNSLRLVHSGHIRQFDLTSSSRVYLYGWRVTRHLSWSRPAGCHGRGPSWWRSAARDPDGGYDVMKRSGAHAMILWCGSFPPALVQYWARTGPMLSKCSTIPSHKSSGTCQVVESPR